MSADERQLQWQQQLEHTMNNFGVPMVDQLQHMHQQLQQQLQAAAAAIAAEEAEEEAAEAAEAAAQRDIPAPHGRRALYVGHQQHLPRLSVLYYTHLG